MLRWEYALLVRRREASGPSDWRMSYTWYSPDGTRQDVSALGDTAISHLNRAGVRGWELVSTEEDVNNLEGTTEVHRYYLKRPITDTADDLS